jgi:hypothetical protein
MTQLVMSMNTAKGSRFFHSLKLLRKLAARLKEQIIGTQWMFWLTNHTPSCSWDTYEQLEYHSNQDARAFLCNPGFAPLKTWEEQVKAAIIAASQESTGLSKDGRTLLRPVLPRLMAKQNQTPCRDTTNRVGRIRRRRGKEWLQFGGLQQCPEAYASAGSRQGEPRR